MFSFFLVFTLAAISVPSVATRTIKDVKKCLKDNIEDFTKTCEGKLPGKVAELKKCIAAESEDGWMNVMKTCLKGKGVTEDDKLMPGGWHQSENKDVVPISVRDGFNFEITFENVRVLNGHQALHKTYAQVSVFFSCIPILRQPGYKRPDPELAMFAGLPLPFDIVAKLVPFLECAEAALDKKEDCTKGCANASEEVAKALIDCAQSSLPHPGDVSPLAECIRKISM